MYHDTSNVDPASTSVTGPRPTSNNIRNTWTQRELWEIYRIHTVGSSVKCIQPCTHLQANKMRHAPTCEAKVCTSIISELFSMLVFSFWELCPENPAPRVPLSRCFWTLLKGSRSACFGLSVTDLTKTPRYIFLPHDDLFLVKYLGKCRMDRPSTSEIVTKKNPYDVAGIFCWSRPIRSKIWPFEEIAASRNSDFWYNNLQQPKFNQM